MLNWDESIRKQFPDWQTAAALARWPTTKSALSIGQRVSGSVIARAPFGVWVDINVGHPALLLVPEMRDARERRLQFDDYPALGEKIEASIVALTDRAEIGLTQNPEIHAIRS